MEEFNSLLAILQKLAPAILLAILATLSTAQSIQALRRFKRGQRARGERGIWITERELQEKIELAKIEAVRAALEKLRAGIQEDMRWVEERLSGDELRVHGTVRGGGGGQVEGSAGFGVVLTEQGPMGKILEYLGNVTVPPQSRPEQPEETAK